MLSIQDVHTYYGESHILQGMSFEVPHGKCIALLGRNGAGKTTTIHSIAGLVPPRTGKISFMGTDITKLPPYSIARLGIGLVPQGRRIFPSLTVKENLLLPARTNKDSGKQEQWDLEKIYELFPVLKERENNMGTQLSGGQQQMLAIGRALMTNPKLILMDEPSEGLAPIIVDHIQDIIVKLKHTGISILIVEQNLSLACSVADNVLLVNKGTIVWYGGSDELLADNELKQKYLGV